MKERPTNAYLSIGAFARAYGVSRQTVYKLLQADLLDTHHVLGLTRIKNLAPELHAHAAAKLKDSRPLT